MGVLGGLRISAGGFKPVTLSVFIGDSQLLNEALVLCLHQKY